MKVPCRWLSEYVDVDVTDDGIRRLAERLTLAGLEVEEITHVPGVTGAVVGRVLNHEPHPNSDHLSICRLDIGSEELEVICGADNVVDGRLVPVITVGGELPGGFKITRRKLRGVESHGMICSKTELGLEGKSDGIWNFDESLDLAIGTDIAELLEFDDYVLQIKVTSNRPDCMGIYGIAREVAAITDRKLRPLELSFNESEPSISDAGFSIAVEAASDTPRYTARLMSGVRVAASPLIMQHRLLKAGMRPLANVIDVTNYVMLELGQPLHPFDADRIGKKISICRARTGERFRTLDSVDRDLTDDVLMIADEEGGLAVAGVMGGERSEISSATTRVLLESAVFEPTTIRSSSRTLGLRSEASQRFERGIDPQGTTTAALRTAHLLQRMTGCSVHVGTLDSAPGETKPRKIDLRTARVSSLLGIEIDETEIATLLGRLEIAAMIDKDGVNAAIPSFRRDLDREVDLIEEVGRLYGYDRFPSTPPRGIIAMGKKDAMEIYKDRVRAILTSLGMNEVVTDGFNRRDWSDRLSLPEEGLVTTKNPMTVGQKLLRGSLLPGILAVVQSNLNQRIDGGMLFEVGRVFSLGPSARPYNEREMLAGVLFGRTNMPLSGKEEMSLPLAKGILGEFLHALNVEKWTTDTTSVPPFLHPGRGARIDAGGAPLGFLGELAPSVSQELPGESRVIVFEIELEAIRSHAEEPRMFAELQRFPVSKRDLSLIAPIGLPEGAISDALRAQDMIEQVLLYDLYQGEQVGEGKRSLTYEISLRAPDHTLTDEEVAAVIARIEKQLAKIDVTLRG